MKDEVRAFKRDRILSTATELFHERGFQGASIDALAEQLGVTKPFIYTYFHNKHALLEEMYERAILSLLQGLDDVLNSEHTPVEQLKSLVEYYVRQNVQNRSLTSIFLNEERNLTPEVLNRFRIEQRRFDKELTSLITRGVDDGSFSIDDPAVAALSIDGMVRWVHRWYQPGGRLTIDELCAKMSTLALNLVGYKAPTGKKSRS